MATPLWRTPPEARGPLIVDSCLGIGRKMILPGMLDLFGHGLAPKSADRDSMSNRGRPFVRLASTLRMAVALMTRALRLNLMTPGLRQQSLKG